VTITEAGNSTFWIAKENTKLLCDICDRVFSSVSTAHLLSST